MNCFKFPIVFNVPPIIQELEYSDFTISTWLVADSIHNKPSQTAQSGLDINMYVPAGYIHLSLEYYIVPECVGITPFESLFILYLYLI